MTLTAPDNVSADAVRPRLRISEIFHSIQGEADAVGWPTVFIRLTGCPLRCTWCDTAYAFEGGAWRSLDEILAEVKNFGAQHVCVTGGEPLAQKRCLDLLGRLCDVGYDVSLETSGAIDIAPIDPRVRRVMDWKAPASGESARNLIGNLAHLNPRDQLKIVIADRDDYDWAIVQLRKHDFVSRCTVLLSPVYGQLEPRILAEWILEDRLPVRLQIQLHKYLWGEEQGR